MCVCVCCVYVCLSESVVLSSCFVLVCMHRPAVLRGGRVLVEMCVYVCVCVWACMCVCMYARLRSCCCAAFTSIQSIVEVQNKLLFRHEILHTNTFTVIDVKWFVFCCIYPLVFRPDINVEYIDTLMFSRIRIPDGACCVLNCVVRTRSSQWYKRCSFTRSPFQAHTYGRNTHRTTHQLSKTTHNTARTHVHTPIRIHMRVHAGTPTPTHTYGRSTYSQVLFLLLICKQPSTL